MFKTTKPFNLKLKITPRRPEGVSKVMLSIFLPSARLAFPQMQKHQHAAVGLWTTWNLSWVMLARAKACPTRNGSTLPWITNMVHSDVIAWLRPGKPTCRRKIISFDRSTSYTIIHVPECRLQKCTALRSSALLFISWMAIQDVSQLYSASTACANIWPSWSRHRRSWLDRR